MSRSESPCLPLGEDQPVIHGARPKRILPIAFAGFASVAAPSQADRIFVPESKHGVWVVVSPQAGSTVASNGGFVGGTTVSLYGPTPAWWGIGAGAYLYGRNLQTEALAKLGLLGLVGASAGAALQDGHVGFAGDLWGSAALVGLRYKLTILESGPSHAWTVFLPLWYLSMKLD